MFTAKIYKKIERRHTWEVSKTLAKSQFWSLEKIRSYQFDKLKKILAHAFENVPYYRNVFNGLGITPADIRNRKDFSCLPILTKDIIRKNRKDLVATNFSKTELIPNSTGGSTGEPLHFFQDNNYELWADTARIRGWYHIAGCNYWDKTAVIWGAMHEVKEDFSLWERVREFVKYGDISLNAFNLSEKRKRKFLGHCKMVRPQLLRGYTTALKDMASFLEDNHLEFPKIKGIILCAETVDRTTQRYIEKIFKAPSYNTYGGRELSLIGMECREHNGLHEISENNYVEFDPIELSDYENAGDLVITNLNNYAMPFLRYKIGDIGVPGSQETCACGRSLPRIEKVIGRTTEVFAFFDGTRIAGEMFIHLMKDFPVSEYQFIQNSEKSIILRLKKSDRLGEDVRKKIGQTYKGYLPDGVALSFQDVEAFEKTKTGKFRFVLKDFSI